MNRLTICVAISALAVSILTCPPSGSADEPPKPAAQATTQSDAELQTTSFWMAKKLNHSQGILRALAESDFEDIAEHAHQLQRLNKVEGFVRRRNPEYTAHVQYFARISKELAQQAEQENIEGATLAFNQLTVSCVRCHQTLRQHDQAQDLHKPATTK